MTSTTTERDALSLTRDTLSLVVVSPDYFRTGEQHSLMPNGDEESRTYYATASRLMGDEWAALIVGWDTDPRGQVGWRVGDDYADLVGPNHGGWNIRRQYLTPVVSDESSDDETRRPASADADEATRRAMPIAEAYPVGSRWEHRPSSVTVTVTGHHAEMVDVTRDDGHPSSGWVRGALDLYGTFLGWSGPETAVEEVGRTFTQEEVDRLVREAREATRLEDERRFEAWKEHASEIACQYADDNNLCGEFERCMDEIGLKGRRREYDVAVTFNVRVEARDEDDAEEQAAEIIRDDFHYRLPDATYDVEEA